MCVEFILTKVIDEMKNIKMNGSKINDAGTTAYYEWLNDIYVKRSYINEAFICNIMINDREIIDTDYSKLSKNTRELMKIYIHIDLKNVAKTTA